MSDISGQLIKDSYSYILQADTSTGYVYRVNGNVPINPIFSSGLTVFSAFTFVDGNQQNGYVLTSDGSGNSRWAAVSGASVASVTASTGLSGNSTTGAITLINTSPDKTVVITGGTNIEIVSDYPNFGINFTGNTSTSGNYLPLSGGTVTGGTIFQSGLTANTISATTYYNVNAVTGGTYSNGVITLSGTGSVNGNQITGLSALTPNTLYSGDGSLLGNRIVNIDGYTLNFSGSGATNNLVLSGGSVGIGKFPVYKLDVNGDINFPTTTGSTYGIIRQNGTALFHTYGTGNLFLGVSSGNFTTSGSGNNVGVGINTLQSNTIGYSNSAIGKGSLSNNTTGFANVGVGVASLRENTIGGTNVAIGGSALQNNLTGSSNVAIGNSAGLNETGSNKLYIANTDTKTLIYGEFDTNRVGINTTSLSNAFTVSASTNPVKFIGLQSSSDTRFVTSDSTGVLSYRSDVLTTGSTITAATIYNFNGTLTDNRIVNLSSYTLNFSSATNPNTLVLSGGNIGIGTTSPTNALTINATTDPLKLEGLQTSSDTEVLSVDVSGVVHKISTSSISGFLRNETHSGATDTITINQSIFNPSNLTVLSTSVFIVDTNADYYILGDLYNYGSVIVNGTLKVGGIIYNYGTITGSGIIE